VLRQRIDENPANPLLPAVMCRMLWQGVTGYCDSPRVYACMRTAIVKEVMPLLAELYEQLDEALDALGVPDQYWIGEDGVADQERR